MIAERGDWQGSGGGAGAKDQVLSDSAALQCGRHPRMQRHIAAHARAPGGSCQQQELICTPSWRDASNGQMMLSCCCAVPAAAARRLPIVQPPQDRLAALADAPLPEPTRTPLGPANTCNNVKEMLSKPLFWAALTAGRAGPHSEQVQHSQQSGNHIRMATARPEQRAVRRHTKLENPEP